ncbi:hypothetical protein ACR30L_10685 [Psychromonas sp. PT13]|uniref:hypothetical protein n=1 Tax=Psychromonas sp. PT13 TaxID=3439547 RepID=UPI003EBDFE78
MKTMYQNDKYSTPWPLFLRLKKYLWDVIWLMTCRPTPKPLNGWRVFIFKLFGGSTSGDVFIHQSARIHFPWNVTLLSRACLGERAWVYSVGKIQIGEESTIAQEAFLCSGTHDFASKNQELMLGSINIGNNVFVAAKAIILPDITVGHNCIVGAGSVLTKSLKDNSVAAGNPARVISSRFN